MRRHHALHYTRRRRALSREFASASSLCYNQLRSNFWVEKNGEVVLSEWRVALLEAVEATGSINAAAARD